MILMLKFSCFDSCMAACQYCCQSICVYSFAYGIYFIAQLLFSCHLFHFRWLWRGRGRRRYVAHRLNQLLLHPLSNVRLLSIICIILFVDNIHYSLNDHQISFILGYGGGGGGYGGGRGGYDDRGGGYGDRGGGGYGGQQGG